MPEQSADRDRSRGPLTAFLLLLFLLALPVHAQDPVTVALLVTAEKLDAVGPALTARDALTRAAAARVALVRSLDSLVPQLREVLASEHDANAAREQIRAIVMLGSDEDVAFAASQMTRFPASMDGEFAEAVGRLGAPRATALYLKHVAASRDPVPAVELALWGRTSQINIAAARLMNDERAFGKVLDAAASGNVPLDSGILQSALGSPLQEVVADTIWYLVEAHAVDPEKIPEPLREAATAKREGAPNEVLFGAEVLRRMLGAELVEQTALLPWLKSEEGRARVPDGKPVRRFLTLGEQEALGEQKPDLRTEAPMGKHPSQGVRKPDFRLTVKLPPGLADQILTKMKCSQAWIGLVAATVDRAGRVQTLDATRVGSSPGCVKALDALLRLSLASPEDISSPLATTDLLVVKPGGRSVCADEDAVLNVPRVSTYPRRAGGEIKPPKVAKRVEPRFPESARQAMGGGSVLVIAEAIITKTGCVRDIRLLLQSPWPELNTAAVLALSEWKFKPGTLNGAPVDVIFNLTVNFKMK